jgi:hypothetical protein
MKNFQKISSSIIFFGVVNLIARVCAPVVFIYLFIYLFIYYYYWVQETRKQRTPMSDKPNYLDLGGVVYRWQPCLLRSSSKKVYHHFRGMDGRIGGWMNGWMDGPIVFPVPRSHRECFGSCVVLVGWFINNKFSVVPF